MIITADEEWAAVNGSRKVLQWLKKQGKNPSKFIVGEPSSPDELASHIKVGRRGSLIGNIEISGVEGHRAYPSLYKNPNKLFQFVNMAVNSLKWNDGNNFIPDTDIEINAINSGNFVASAIVPNNLSAMYAIRYTDKQSKEQLFTVVRTIIANPPEYLKAHPDYKYYIDNLDDIKVTANLDTVSIPYYSQPNKLAFNTVSAVEKVLGRTPVLDSTGGTTDGRFVHEFFPDAEIIELGLPEKGGIIDKIKRDDYGTCGGMHQINERASIKDIFNLANIYSEVINSLRIKNKNEQSDNRGSNRARFRCNGASL